VNFGVCHVHTLIGGGAMFLNDTFSHEARIKCFFNHHEQACGFGTSRRSYLYAADLAVRLWTILFKCQSCRSYNVGSEGSLSIAEVAEQVAEQFKPKLKVDIRMESDPQKLPERYIPDISRARNELGFKKYIPLPDAILRTIRWN